MTDDLRQRIADALTAAAYDCDGKCDLDERACYDAHPIIWSAMAGGTTHVDGSVTAIADAALAALKPELDELLHYRNAITWGTSCLSCSRILDNARAREEELERNVDYFKRNVRRSRDQVDGYDRELSAAKAAIDRVRALHERREGDDGSTYCDVCSNHGDITWPCATIAALDGQEATK